VLEAGLVEAVEGMTTEAGDGMMQVIVDLVVTGGTTVGEEAIDSVVGPAEDAAGDADATGGTNAVQATGLKVTPL